MIQSLLNLETYKNYIIISRKKIITNLSVHELWLNLFTLQLETIVDENIVEVHVHIFLDMYGNVVDKNCNMSATQFRKSYRAKQRSLLSDIVLR